MKAEDERATEAAQGPVRGGNGASCAGRLNAPEHALSLGEDVLDPFNPEALRLPQDFASSIGAAKIQLSVPVEKPGKQTYFRVHPDPEWRLDTAVLELRDKRETYLVAPHLRADLATEVIHKTLVTYITRQGDVGIWPIRMPRNESRFDRWSESAREIAELATRRWVRLVSNMQVGGYDAYEAIGNLSGPLWPEHLTFRDLLERAFRDRRIDSLDHPVVRELRGLV